MNFITVKCRGTSLMLPIKEIESLTEQDWFLKLLIKYEDKSESVELGEDINIVLSIIETLKYKKLIMYNNISLEHMYMLCDKWCVPSWILDEISDKIQKKTENNLDEKIYLCQVCNIGFKKSENTNSSCKRHRLPFCGIKQNFPCCNNNEACIRGYHYNIE